MIHIQIDQSGRIEVLTVDTVLGFSNSRQRAVLISAAVKRNCSKQLLARGIRPKLVSIRMFAAGVYLLLEHHLNQIESVTIDREFPGWEAEIKGLVLQQIYRRAPRFASEKINFGEIGKHARAHQIVWRTYRKERVPEKKITLGELLRFC